jgi:hypothetical protein
MTARTKWASRDTCTIAKRCLKFLQGSVIEQLTVNALVNEKMETDGIEALDAAASVLRNRQLRNCSAARRRRLEAVDWKQVAVFVIEHFQPFRQSRWASLCRLGVGLFLGMAENGWPWHRPRRDRIKNRTQATPTAGSCGGE